MLLKDIKNYCDKHQLLKPHMKIIVGLSGGPDSVFLLHILVQLKQYYQGLELIAAHLDHGWRPESAQDVIFCNQLAQELQVPFIARHASEITITQKHQSKEDLGRRLRRAFFESLAHEHNAQAIALGQHADDQEETFFIRLIRGTSLSGLASIRVKQGLYIRPLLSLYKQNILNYLHENYIAYLTDPTNTSNDFLRNRVRKYVVPALRASDQRFDRNCIKTIELLQKTDAYLEKHTQQLLQEITHTTSILSIEKLLALDEFMHQRIVLAWLINNSVVFPVNAGFFKELLNFLRKPGSGTYTIPQAWSITKKDRIATIAKYNEQVQYNAH